MSQELVIKSQELEGGITILELRGYLDATTFDMLDSEVGKILSEQRGRRILLSLERLRGISSAGAGTMLSLSEQARMAGGRLIITSVPPEIKRTLNILGLLATDSSELQRLYLVENQQKAINCFD